MAAELVVAAARMYATNRPGRIAFGVAPTQLGEGASRSALLIASARRWPERMNGTTTDTTSNSTCTGRPRTPAAA